MIHHKVPMGVREEELSRYLRRAWPLLPEHVLRELLKRRDVRVNGVRSGRGMALHGGEVLDIYGDACWFEAGVDVLFDDGRLLVAVKPQGLPSLPDRDGVGADTMEARLKRSHPTARLCHRLDTAAGGVMLAALDDETEARALAAFRNRELSKNYRALLLGEALEADSVFHAYLFKDAKRGLVRVSGQASPGSQAIVTRVRPIRCIADGLWEAGLEPITGRTHQLRAHMAYLKRPILGDDRYGDRAANRRFGCERKLCLWCARIEIPPVGALADWGDMHFEAPPPDWLKGKAVVSDQ